MWPFKQSDEAERLFRQAKRCGDPLSREFDLHMAISLLENAVAQKPDREEYRLKLQEFNEVR